MRIIRPTQETLHLKIWTDTYTGNKTIGQLVFYLHDLSHLFFCFTNNIVLLLTSAIQSNGFKFVQKRFKHYQMNNPSSAIFLDREASNMLINVNKKMNLAKEMKQIYALCKLIFIQY